MNSILQSKLFLEYKEPVVFDGYEAIGYFPYETARLVTSFESYCPVPRSIFAHIEEAIRISPSAFMGNKVVIVFRDTTNFGTSDFVISFHDLSCRVGKWDHVVKYDGRPL